MRRMKALVIAIVCGGSLAISAAAFTLGTPQNSNSSSQACCNKEGCCEPGAMNCCKKKTKRGKNAHSCCKKNNGADCCCSAESCTMPNKPANTNTH
ncbi:MAG TPA: hypothetical protein VJT71_18340 [Pyrinomonadaceae bacterium]|nr:hypothetical protein [Pyrinomonadaceae bacterium]